MKKKQRKEVTVNLSNDLTESNLRSFAQGTGSNLGPTILDMRSSNASDMSSNISNRRINVVPRLRSTNKPTQQKKELSNIIDDNSSIGSTDSIQSLVSVNSTTSRLTQTSVKSTDNYIVKSKFSTIRQDSLSKNYGRFHLTNMFKYNFSDPNHLKIFNDDMKYLFQEIPFDNILHLTPRIDFIIIIVRDIKSDTYIKFHSGYFIKYIEKTAKLRLGTTPDSDVMIAICMNSGGGFPRHGIIRTYNINYIKLVDGIDNGTLDVKVYRRRTFQELRDMMKKYYKRSKESINN